MSPKTVVYVSGTNHPMRTVVKQLSDSYRLVTVKKTGELKHPHYAAILLSHAPPMRCCLADLQEIARLWPQVPVIVLTEPVPPAEVAELFRQGVKDVLFLPVQREELQDALFRQTGALQQQNNMRWLQKIRYYCVSNLLRWKHSAWNRQHFVHPLTTGVSNKAQPAPQAKSDLQAQFFGSFSIMFKGKNLELLSGKKARNLLAYLLFRYPRKVHRELLLEKFWGDSTPSSARNCLHVTLHAIRKSFEQIAPGQQVILYQDESYGLHPDISVERDFTIFEYYWKKGRQLERAQSKEEAVHAFHQAFAFYRGDFLEDLPCEEWAGWEREKFRETWLVILDRLSDHFHQHRFHICLNLCRRMLEKDPCLEEAHRRLMECYNMLEMRDKAMRQFQKCEKHLMKELNANPGKATVDLYLKIRENY